MIRKVYFKYDTAPEKNTLQIMDYFILVSRAL